MEEGEAGGGDAGGGGKAARGGKTQRGWFFATVKLVTRRGFFPIRHSGYPKAILDGQFQFTCLRLAGPIDSVLRDMSIDT